MVRKLLLIGIGHKEKKYWYTKYNTGTLLLSSIIKYIVKNNTNLSENIEISYNFDNITQQIPNCFLYINNVEYEIIGNISYLHKSNFTLNKYFFNKNLLANQIVVFFEDDTLPFGNWKLNFSNFHNDHCGLKLISSFTKGQKYKQLAIGIEKKFSNGSNNFSEKDLEIIDNIAKEMINDNLLKILS